MLLSVRGWAGKTRSRHCRIRRRRQDLLAHPAHGPGIPVFFGGFGQTIHAPAPAVRVVPAAIAAAMRLRVRLWPSFSFSAAAIWAGSSAVMPWISISIAGSGVSSNSQGKSFFFRASAVGYSKLDEFGAFGLCRPAEHQCPRLPDGGFQSPLPLVADLDRFQVEKNTVPV
jgi:hypothetical protein